MKILNLELEDIRNFKYLNIDFQEQLTVIYGKNSSGKTNLLESIYYLTLAKSPRKGKEIDVININKKEGRIRGVYKTDQDKGLEIEFILGSNKIGKIDKVPSKIKDIVGKACSVLFTVEDLNIIESLQKRRRFINILSSLLSKKYFLDLIEYQQVLKRRNKALLLLKDGRSEEKELSFWDERLSSLGCSIINKRKDVILKINKILKSSPLFFKDSPLILGYRPQVYSSKEMLKALKDKLEKDIIIGQTTVGPHRDIIVFRVKNLDLDLYGSRGEKRSAIIELKRAEIELIKEEKKVTPILLLDDVFSELDENNRENILKLIKNQQTIIATIEFNHLGEEIKKAKVYKIEDGSVSQK